MMNEYIWTWHEIEELAFKIDRDGDNLEGFRSAIEFIKTRILPDYSHYQMGWDTDRFSFRKNDMEFLLEYDNWHGIVLYINNNYTQIQKDQCRIWAQEMYDQVHKDDVKE